MKRLRTYYIPGGWQSFIAIIVSTVVVSYFHFAEAAGHSIVHFFHYYFFYLIVIYSAHRFGFLGGLVSSFALSMIYNARVYLIFDLDDQMLRPLIEVVMMYTLGIFSGIYVQKRYLEQEKLWQVSEELKRSLNQLEQNAAEKIRLEKEMAKSDRLRVLGQLTAGIAHEIRNPLAAIKAGVGMIRDGKQDRTIFDVVTAEIDRLNTFVERFLQYARIGKGSDSDIPVRALTEELAELVRLTCKDKAGIEFTVSVNVPEPSVIRGDKNYLKQALLNILLNGIEAVEKLDRPGMVSLTVLQENTTIIYIIRDNGLGIAEAHIDAIFEPFFTTKDTGTGLGLTIAAKVIREHGGDIFVENDNGARFIIKLPMAGTAQ